MREGKDLNQEEGEEISFVPSAISVPQKPLFRCDNRCSEKTNSFWQSASVVMKEGEESYTTILCQQRYNKSLEAKGDKPLTKWQWYEFVEKEEQDKPNNKATREQNRSSTHVQILCSSTESPCTCHCTVKLYRTAPWTLARATSSMPRVQKVPTRSRCIILKACQVLD